MLDVDIHCPNCNSRGIVTVPSIYSLLIGKCPECGELIAIFFSRCFCLPLEFLNMAKAEQIETLKTLLIEDLNSFLDVILEKYEQYMPSSDSIIEKPKNKSRRSSRQSSNNSEKGTPISSIEVIDFKKQLNLLDDNTFFKKTFGD